MSMTATMAGAVLESDIGATSGQRCSLRHRTIVRLVTSRPVLTLYRLDRSHLRDVPTLTIASRIRMALKITWRQLRQLAESAQGLQEERLGVRRDAFGRFIVEAYNVSNSNDYLFELDAIPNPKPGKLAVKLPGIQVNTLPYPVPNDDFSSIADAVFWSMAAVEKFLVPYYSSMHELERVMREVRDLFKDQSVLAFIHLPNSEIVGGGEATMVNLFAVRPVNPGSGEGPYELIPVL